MTDKRLSSEQDFIEYLKKINFSKHLAKIAKKLKEKKVIIYGAGAFFQTINREYDLSCLNIIAIADRKFVNHEDGEEFLGYRLCSPDEMESLQTDYVLVSMINFINVIEDLEETSLKNAKVKIKPLINKPFVDILKELWS